MADRELTDTMTEQHLSDLERIDEAIDILEPDLAELGEILDTDIEFRGHTLVKLLHMSDGTVYEATMTSRHADARLTLIERI